jgi:ABC-type antimicrobial peptide transport system permease subunit
MLGRALVLATFGLLLGFFAAIALNRALRSFVYGVSTLNIVIYGGAVVALIIVAVVASYLPARRASRLDPAVVLRAE